MRDGFTRAPTGGFGRIGVALCPSATASKALARATWAAGSACERLMRTSQTRSWSVSFRRGSFWRRLIGKPPGEVEELAAYSTFAGIATPMATDPLVLGSGLLLGSSLLVDTPAAAAQTTLTSGPCGEQGTLNSQVA